MTSALITPNQLAAAQRAASESIRVLDASYFGPVAPPAYDGYVAAHIPGAGFFDIDAIAQPDTELPHMLPEADEFAAAMRSLGLTNGHRVVVYDQRGIFSAARAWWMFRVFGHDAVQVLDGGLPLWRELGHAVVSGPAAVLAEMETSGFRAQRRPELVVDLAHVRAFSGQVVDARSEGRFTGEAMETWVGRRAGHIPKSRNVPYSTLLDEDGLRLRSTEELRARFAQAGIDVASPIVTTCGSGVTACVLALALFELGHEKVPVYDGSWAEWGLPDGPPVETGPASPIR